MYRYVVMKAKLYFEFYKSTIILGLTSSEFKLNN